MPVNLAERKFFEQLAEQQTVNSIKPLTLFTVEEFRTNSNLLLMFAGNAADIQFTDSFVSVRDDYKVPIRIYNSVLKQTTPVLIFYPGCGYVLDLFEVNAISCSRIAQHAKIKVVLVNFRLAPEHALPTSIYDGYDVTCHLATHAKSFGINPDKIFIGGLSSGAHCAAVVSKLAQDNKELKIHHQILLNGIYDLAQTNQAYKDYAEEDKICTQEAIDFLLSHYGIKAEQYTNPLYSPYYESNLTDFPSTTIIVGEYDRLRSESEAYYIKLKNAGVKINKILLPGQTHNTLLMRQAMSDGVDPAETIAEVIKQNSK